MTDRDRFGFSTERFARRSVGVMFVIILVVGLGAATGTAAADAPDCSTVSYNGDGTTSSPYEVGNVDQLQCIENQGLDASYELVSDIDATGTSSWNFGSGFEPIGDNNNPFTGGLTGNGNTITGLTINRGSLDEVGLFGQIGSGGGVQGVNLKDVEISGANRVGALAGDNSGNIIRSSATGTVTGSGLNAGGLIGFSEGTVSRSFAMVRVNSNTNVGGLIGNNDGGSITNSYARGNASGSNDPSIDHPTGGLVGLNRGSVTQSYSTGDISGGNAFETSIGGFVGTGGGTVSQSYWDVPASGETGSAGGTGLGDISDTPPADEMTGDDAPNNMQGFDFTNTWDTVTGPDGYPILAWQVEPTATFTVSPTNPETEETVTFDASGSDSPDGTIQTYDWDFDGDGTTDETTTTPTATTTYSSAGDFTVELTVTDNDGETDTATQTFSVVSSGSLNPNNPFGDSNNNPVDRSTVIDRVVEWNLNGEINGTSYTRQEIIDFVVGWNLAS
jgi:PKD repeat protein